jgi:hypothetical protein
MRPRAPDEATESGICGASLPKKVDSSINAAQQEVADT